MTWDAAIIFLAGPMIFLLLAGAAWREQQAIDQ